MQQSGSSIKSVFLANLSLISQCQLLPNDKERAVVLGP